MTPRTLLPLAALALLSCGDDILSDASFDRWCGQSLCAWQTDEGAIARTASWHREDYAVELVEAPTQISQRTRTSAPCFVVRMIADVEPASDTALQVDFNDDGSVDYERALPRSAWKLAQFPITAPDTYLGARFILRKRKAGRAVVAQLRVEEARGCAGPAVLLEDAQAGALCSRDQECRSGACREGRCAECVSAAECAEGELCVSHVCSACASDGDCAEGQRCAWLGARVADGRGCMASHVELAKGLLAPCERDDECLSGACASVVGALRVCGQPCDPSVPLCGAAEVCRSVSVPGFVESTLCAPPAELGDDCSADEQCASQACCQNRCVASEEAC